MDQHHPGPKLGPADRQEAIHTPVGMLRRIEGDEALSALRAVQAFCRWQAARDCALQLFGPRATLVLIRIEWLGDDMSGYEPFARKIIAYNLLGQRLPYDLSSPYWRRSSAPMEPQAPSLLDEWTEYVAGEDEGKRASMLQELADDYVHEFLYEWGFALHECLGTQLEIPLDQPPAGLLPVLYQLVSPGSGPTAVDP